VGLHEFGGAKPGRRLLTNFAKGMEVSQMSLLFLAFFEHFLGDWLDFREVV
jgi:hypothetical protein